MSKIAVGFPKLALSKVNVKNYFPRYYNDWVMVGLNIVTGELLVLVNASYGGRFHYVPVAALESGTVPLSAITNWTSSYSKFPIIRAESIQILSGTDPKLTKDEWKLAAF